MFWQAFFLRWRPLFAVIAIVIVLPAAAYGYLHWQQQRNASCIVLVASGNRLCGDDARAWCTATDELRRSDPSQRASQRACDRIRAGR
jgi:hypothetical protein